MQIFKAELKSWMLGEFASLKSKHDNVIAEANQQNLPNVIANKVKQFFFALSLRAEGAAIFSTAQ